MPYYWTPRTARREVPNYEIESTPSEVLTETFAQTFEENPFQMMTRSQELRDAEGRIRRGFSPRVNRITPDQAKARVESAGLTGQLAFDSDTTEEAVDLLIERKRQELKRQEIWARSPGGVSLGAQKLAVSLGTSLADPAGAALNFVPVVSQAKYARWLNAAGGTLGRVGVRAGVGAIEGAAGAAIYEPLLMTAKASDQADYDMLDSLMNVGFGTVLGGGLHSTAGFLADTLSIVGSPSRSAPMIEHPIASRSPKFEPRQEETIETIPSEEIVIRREIERALDSREAQLRSVADSADARAVAIRGPGDDSARLAQMIAARDSDAAFVAESRDRQISEEAKRLAFSDNANAYAIRRSRDAGGKDEIFDRWHKRAIDRVDRLRASAKDRVDASNKLIASLRSDVDRFNRVHAAANDLAQSRYARGTAKTVDDLVDALPSDMQSGFKSRLEKGRKSGDVRPVGSRLPQTISDAIDSIPIKQRENMLRVAVGQAMNGHAVDLDGIAPASLVPETKSAQEYQPVDVLAERSYEPEPIKQAADPVAEQEQILADLQKQYDEAASVADIEPADFSQFDEAIQNADTYAKAARAAVLCGLGHAA